MNKLNKFCMKKQSCGFFSIQIITNNGCIQSVFMSSMNTQLMCSSCSWVKIYPRLIFFSLDDLPISFRFFSVFKINQLFGSVIQIQTNWKAVDYTAKPYLAAMSDLESINDQYGSDDGRIIVNYFLANASKWRGDVAKRVKAELNQMLKKRASDRSSLIRLASSLPVGSVERKAILAGLGKATVEGGFRL